MTSMAVESVFPKMLAVGICSEILSQQVVRVAFCGHGADGVESRCSRLPSIPGRRNSGVCKKVKKDLPSISI
jgi:hypothetical protein